MTIKKNTSIINIDDDVDFAVNSARKLFFEGKVFVYPTDTVYGFGANPFNNEPLDRINFIKQREDDKKYIMLISDIQTLTKYVIIENESHLDFLVSIWPNPISIILKLNENTKKLLNIDTAAFRIPNHNFCSKLLSKLKMPLISTSVNRKDEPPMDDCSMIRQEFNFEVDALFCSQKKTIHLSSTLIDLTKNEPILIREGKIKFNEIMNRFIKTKEKANVDA